MVSTLLFFPRTQRGFRVPGIRVLLQIEASLHPFPFFNLHCPDPETTSVQQDLVHDREGRIRCLEPNVRECELIHPGD